MADDDAPGAIFKNAIGESPRPRPVVPTRPPPLAKSARPGDRNPFTALEEAQRELAGAHERLRSLATRLIGELPEFQQTNIVPAQIGGGLFGLTASTAHVMSARVHDINDALQRLEEFLT
jgi:hypothetical protein